MKNIKNPLLSNSIIVEFTSTKNEPTLSNIWENVVLNEQGLYITTMHATEEDEPSTESRERNRFETDEEVHMGTEHSSYNGHKTSVTTSKRSGVIEKKLNFECEKLNTIDFKMFTTNSLLMFKRWFNEHYQNQDMGGDDEELIVCFYVNHNSTHGLIEMYIRIEDNEYTDTSLSLVETDLTPLFDKVSF